MNAASYSSIQKKHALRPRRSRPNDAGGHELGRKSPRKLEKIAQAIILLD
jgi:hypothetical protein